MKARTKPVHVARAGNVRVPVYKYAGRARADGRLQRARYCVCYQKSAVEKAKRETFTDRTRAIGRAEEMAIAIANGRADVLELTNADRDSYVHALRVAEPFNVPLHVAIEEWAAARRALGPTANLIAAAEAFARPATPAPARMSGAEVLARLVASISEAEPRTMGEYRYRLGIKNDLGRFVAAHPRLEDVTASHLRDYLRSLGVGPRRRDNVRDEIVTLFRFAKTRDGGELFPLNTITEAELVKRLDAPTAITTYSAEELTLLLKFIAPRWMPWMVIAAFSGLRPTEILRLEWSALKWVEKPEPRIAIPPLVAHKTRKPRRAELGATLRVWLADYRDAVGPLYGARDLPSETRLLKELGRETKRLSELMTTATGGAWRWKNDALRHSYGSYRYAQARDFALVASWMGNSPRTIQDRYYDSKSESEADAWFGVLPEHAANVIQGRFHLA